MIDHRAAEILLATAIDFPLAPDEQATLDAHLAGCDRCRAIGARLRRDALLLREIPAEHASPAVRMAVEAAAVQTAAHTPRFLFLLAAALLVALAVGGAVVIGSGLLDLDGLSVNPSPSLPSAAASEAPLPSPIFPELGYAQVVTGHLSLRAEPRLGSPEAGTLELEEVVSLLEGPMAADGYTWYRVRSGDVTGWVTAGDGDARLGWIGEMTPPTGAWMLRVQRQAVTGSLNDVPFVLFGDGRLVYQVELGWEQVRLTREGVDLFTRDANSNLLLDASAEFVTPAPDHQGGWTAWSIYADLGGTDCCGPVTVTAIDASDAPEAASILALAEQLIAQVNNLRAAWLVDPDRPPEPADVLAYNLVVLENAGALADYGPADLLGDADVDTVQLPLTTPLLEIGDEFPPTVKFTGARCATLTPQEASALREAFYGLGLPRGEQDDSTIQVRLRWAAQEGVVQLQLNAVLPVMESCVNPFGGTG